MRKEEDWHVIYYCVKCAFLIHFILPTTVVRALVVFDTCCTSFLNDCIYRDLSSDFLIKINGSVIIYVFRTLIVLFV